MAFIDYIHDAAAAGPDVISFLDRLSIYFNNPETMPYCDVTGVANILTRDVSNSDTYTEDAAVDPAYCKTELFITNANLHAIYTTAYSPYLSGD
ncbi:hypothetical protein CFE70_002989 [Pyrenophora teres f. teres 0-1]